MLFQQINKYFCVYLVALFIALYAVVGVAKDNVCFVNNADGTTIYVCHGGYENPTKCPGAGPNTGAQTIYIAEKKAYLYKCKRVFFNKCYSPEYWGSGPVSQYTTIIITSHKKYNFYNSKAMFDKCVSGHL